MNLLDQKDNKLTASPEAMKVRSVRSSSCFCSNKTYDGPGMLMGISEYDDYMMSLDKHDHKVSENTYEVSFAVPSSKKGRTLMVRDQPLPGNVTIGNFGGFVVIRPIYSYLMDG